MGSCPDLLLCQAGHLRKEGSGEGEGRAAAEASIERKGWREIYAFG